MPQAGLVAAYSFNQGTAGGANTAVTSLPDQSGNANSGTLTNFDLSSGNLTSNWVESYALVVPTLAATTAVTTTGFTANWTAPTVGTVDGYVLDYSLSATFATVAGTLSPAAGAGSQAVSGLLPNRNYYYRLRANKTSGTVAGQGAYASGTVRTASGLTAPGNALAFDGSDDYVAVPAAPGLNNLGTGSCTLESWVYCTNLPGVNSIIRKDGDYNLYLNTGGLLGLDVWTGGLGNAPLTYMRTATPVLANQWNHVAATWNGTTIKLYLNGVEVTSTLQNGSGPGGAPLQIGRSTVYNQPFAGRLDEVRIYGAALTAAQVQADMTSTSAAVPASLLLYYNFEQGTASGANAGITTLTDQSSTLADGTLTNFDLGNGNTTSNWVESYALVVPTLTAATANAATSFTANWTAPALGTVSNYVLDVATSNAFTAASLVAGSPLTVASTSTSQAVTGLDPAQTYYYRVRADKASVSGQGAYTAIGVRAPFTPMTPPGNALAFDGTDDYVLVPDANGLDFGAADFTAESWVLKQASSSGFTNSVLMGKWNTGSSAGTNEWLLGLTVGGSDDLPCFWVESGTTTYQCNGFVPLSLNKWHHLVGVRQGTTLLLYVDGQLQASRAIGAAAVNNVGRDLLLGRTAAGAYTNLRLDEARVWNVARTAAQVQAAYTSWPALPQAGLVASYNFDQGTAGGANAGYTTLIDQSGNGNFGTLTNFNLSSGNTTSNWVESYALVVPVLTAATGVSSTGFTANWTAPALGTVDNGYRLDVATSNAFTAASLVAGSPITVASTSQAVTGLDPAQTYYYRVRPDKASVTGQGASTTGTRPATVFQAPPGNALAFDGSDDYVNLGTPASLQFGTGDFTVETWLRDDKPGSVVYVLALGTVGNGNNLWLGAKNGYAALGLSGTDFVTGVAISDGHWHHVAAARRSGTLVIYVDGVASLTQSSGQNVSTNVPFFLGNYSSDAFASGYYWQGRLDETRAYSAGLTQAQVQADMTSTSPAVAASLLLYYNFDQGTASGANAGYTTLTDQSANNAVGTLTNFNLGSGNTTSNWVESYALLQPTGLAASATTSTSLSATWTAPTINGAAPASGEVEGYVLDVSTSSTFASGVTSLTTTGYSATSVAATGLTNGTNYYLRVRAEKASVTGQGDYSAPATTHTIGTDAFLTSLTANAGTLSPAFASATTAYTLLLVAGQSTFTLTPTASNAYTTITANGTAVASGTATTSYPAGTLVTLVLTSEDGQATRTYTVQSVNTPDYYRSVASGNWGDVSTWEGSDDNATWGPVPYAPSAGLQPTVSIRSGHVVTVAADVQINRTTVLSGGTLAVAPGTTLEVFNATNPDLTVNGTLTVPTGAVLLVGRLNGANGYTGNSLRSAILAVSSGATFTAGGVVLLNSGSTATSLAAGTSSFAAGSRVVLFATTTAPVIPVATWDPAATLELAGAVANMTVATSLNGKTLGSLDVNLTGSGLHVLLSGTGTATLTGNLTVTGTGTGTLRLLALANTTGGTLTIGGSYVQNGGLVNGCAATNANLTSATTVAVSVAGSFTVNGGSFTANQGYSATITTIRPNPLTIGGDLLVGSGATFSLVSALQASNNTTNAAAVNYTTSRVQLLGNFTNNGTFTTGNTVASNTGQQLYFAKTGGQAFGNTGTIGGRVNVTVNSGSTLDLGTSAFTGTGTFTTASGATLRLGSPSGISASGTATGNVQSTGTRTFSGNLEYYGPAAQVTGTGLPATLAATSTLIFNNPAGITLSQATSVPGTLSLKQGVITTTATNLLTLGNSTAVPGMLDATTNTGIIVGPFKRWISAATSARTFPVGTPTQRRPASIDFTTAPTTGGSLTAEFIVLPSGNQGLPLTEGSITVNKASASGYWRVAAADGLAGGTYTPSFTFTGASGILDYTQLVLLKRADPSADWALVGTPVPTTGSNAAPVLSRTGVAGFSDFTAGGDFNVNPLPVELTAFTARAQGPAVVLSWTTASEKNSASFEVERSLDGTSFGRIGTVAAAGTSSTTARSYGFEDPLALLPAYPPTLLYYRLRQVDLDGTATYAPVRTVSLTHLLNSSLTIFPNPATGAATLAGTAPGTVVRVYDAVGRVVADATADATGTAALVLPAGLASGVYVVRAGTASLRLVVE